jgi:hypothetical protein
VPSLADDPVAFAQRQREVQAAAEARGGPAGSQGGPGADPSQPQGDSLREYCGGLAHALAPACVGCRHTLGSLGGKLCCTVVHWVMAAAWALLERVAARTGALKDVSRCSWVLVGALVLVALGLYWWSTWLPSAA